MEYGVGIVGLGRVHRGHAQAIQRTEGLRLVAVCDVDPPRVARATEALGCEGEQDMRRLFARPDIQIVDVLLPHGLHEEACVAAAQAGKHIMVEKPMAMDLGACDRMIAAAKEAEVQLFVAHTERFMAPNRKAKELLERGDLGQPVLATDTWYQRFGREQRQPWMLDRSRGGGFLQMAGSHMIDRLVWLLDSPVANVRAVVRTAYHSDIKCDDAVLAFLQLQNGVPCTFGTVSYRDHEHAGVPAHGVEILCEDGILRVGNRRQVFVSRNGQYEEVPIEPEHAVAREWELFARSIREGTEPPVPLAEARHVVAVMDACERSSNSGETVTTG